MWLAILFVHTGRKGIFCLRGLSRRAALLVFQTILRRRDSVFVFKCPNEIFRVVVADLLADGGNAFVRSGKHQSRHVKTAAFHEGGKRNPSQLFYIARGIGRGNVKMSGDVVKRNSKVAPRNIIVQLIALRRQCRGNVLHDVRLVAADKFRHQ